MPKSNWDPQDRRSSYGNEGSLKSTPSKFGRMAKPKGDNRKNAEGKHGGVTSGASMFKTSMSGVCGHDGRFDHVHTKNGGGTMKPKDSDYSGPHSRNG